MFKLNLAAASLAATFLAPLPLAAQGMPPALTGWLDLLRPEMLVQRVMQIGLMGLRSQVDLQYGDMSVDLRLGKVSITDIDAWPFFDWDTNGGCQVSVDRLELRSAAIDTPDQMRFKLQASGLTATADCLPPDSRPPLGMVGLTDLALPRVTLDMVYDIPSAGADMVVFAEIAEALALTLTADFSYLWFDASENPDNPDPVAYLESAALVLENRGAWQALSAQLPPPFTDPAQGGMVLSGLVGQALGQMNRDAAGPEAEGDTSALGEAQMALVDSVAATWPAFLENPSTLVLETGLEEGQDTYLDFPYYEDHPDQLFEDLRPTLTLAPAAARRALPVALVSAAREAVASGDTSGIGADDLRSVGLALLTGDGAPRDRATGRAILAPMAEAGDGGAALALSEALEASEPELAYQYAMVAGAANASGAVSRLDRLEASLPFQRVLQLQTEVVGDVQHPVEALNTVSGIREHAQMRLSGRGMLRSYTIAALWAILGSAAGDAESADILAQIDERVRLSGPEARQAWASVESDVSALAMDAWLGMDLPGRFGGN